MPATGKLRKRVTFEAETQVSDGGGGYELGWSAVLTVWAQLVPERGRERMEAGRLESALGATLVARWDAVVVITESHRVVIDDEPYQIRSKSNPDQRHQFAEFSIEKGVAT